MLLQISPDWITDPRTRKQYLKLNTGHFKHDDIQKKCYDHGGFLPEPRDEQENDFFDSLDSKPFALGMSDRDSEGTWLWESDGARVGFTLWYGGRPQGGNRQNCANTYGVQREKYDRYNDNWETYPCGSRDWMEDNDKSLICQRNTGMCVLLLV